MSRRRVVVVQRVVPHYRVALYRDLRDALAQHGVDLELVHGGGHADPRKARRHDLATLAWAEVAAVRALRLGPRVLAEWQRSTASVRSADVVVLEQASRLVLNHRLLLSLIHI